MGWRPALTAAALAAALFGIGCSQPPPPAKAQGRVVVLGFDGMDPVLTERWMAEGLLPEFARLREEGHYQHLPTSNPPQSPVAWSHFATGLKSGHHGIFDFLRRDAATYRPDFSIAKYTAPDDLNLFGWHLPIGEGTLENLRRGEPFWLTAQQSGKRASVFRVPVTYPPEPVQRMVSGMGVPDLLGTQGTYSYYTTSRVDQAESGGRVVLMRMQNDGGVQTRLDGPQHPLKPAEGVLQSDLHLKFSATQVEVTLAGRTESLQLHQWSDWWPVSFDYGLGSIPGMVRLRMLAGFPRPKLYVSPIHADPMEPVLPLSYPADYAAELAARMGRYHTLGMPEETWSMNQEHLDEQGFLDMVKTTLAEGEAMLQDALDADDSELVVKVFVQTDRVSHMFWRGLDTTHPLHSESSALARGAIPWIYQEADRVLGQVRKQLKPNDELVVLSDHGFAPFRRAAHLNRWLIENGWLALQPGANESQPLFAQVDWSRSRAYALGLNGLFLNLQQREAQGIVAVDQRDALLSELRSALAEWRDTDGTAVVRRSFLGSELYPGPESAHAPDLVIGYSSGYRASWQTSLGAAPAALIEDNQQAWSGDHCIDPELVPGVLFTSFKPETEIEGIAAMARFLLERTPAGPGH
ncbi:alkaline phosphatase family protein [Pseudomarimonas arenosa]|uniref:Alkaline phosphatase family protein n=1 Tax=Pseudomarimonas arenosa TaxID=2774145 RepID=A0AAW3ZMR2_9GAMM|nr:alkaline phosphatase family protein [Pseudomarimonas arenosa]MBD8526482.1 alkaline phosphatase family protein [Pseudomarimonas arenosa]